MPVEEIAFRLPVNGVELEAIACRPERRTNTATSYRLAVIAHPWARLGGSMHDRVVLALAHVLNEASPPIAVITYNARGSCGSTGKASWWGCEAEKRDYEGVVRWAVERAGWLNGEREDMAPDGSEGHQDRPIEVFCCGYSHGSLLAPFFSSDTTDHDPPRSITYRYILVSPPLGVAWFLSPFGWGAYNRAIQAILQRALKARATGQHEAVPSPEKAAVLVISSSKDQFTSHARYQAWTQELHNMAEAITNGQSTQLEQPGSDSLIRCVNMEEADHFWSSRGALSHLVQAVREWM